MFDTSAYSALGRGHSAIRDLVETADEVLFSSIVLGELHLGFRGGDRLEANLADLRAFLQLDHVRAVPVDVGTAEIYGRLARRLRQMGTPIPTNDIWIAAHAVQYEAGLVTTDRHFAVFEFDVRVFDP